MTINDSHIDPQMTFKKLVFLNMQQLTNFPYIEKDFDALTDYQLLCKVVEYLNMVIENSNDQNDSITNLYNAFISLQDYVNTNFDDLETAFNNLQTFVTNYFDNLDVQEEINNKLDQMLEDGVLEQIIEQFLQSTALWCFDTVADMQQATNLVDGSYVRTLGYYSLNDGGGATYKITDTESVTEYQEEVGDLYATLIVNNEVNVKQFGAYGDNVHDDSTAFNNMISSLNKLKVDYGTYKLESSINIPNGCDIDIKGSINYTGTDYGFNISQLTYKKIYIESFSSSTGGMFKLQPGVEQYISFLNIYVKYAYCEKECIYANSTNGIITTIILDGIRWHSTINGCIKLYIGENANSNAFLTEINIKNMDLWSNVFGVDAENNSNNNEIQFNLYELDIENCKGIQTTGRITSVGIYNCRLFEATHKTGWITINNYCPNFFKIDGSGYIYPSKILWNNPTNNKPIITNMTIIDEVTTYNYENGGLLYKDRINPTKRKNVWKDFTNEIVSNKYTLTETKSGGLYNYLQTTTNAWLELSVPSTMDEFYLQTSNAISLTLKIGNRSRVLDYNEFTEGIYKFYLIGNSIKYTKLS